MVRKILIVDDEREVVEFLQKGLVKEGFCVVSAFDGLEAKRKIKDEKPDLILLDLVMPGLNGWEVLKWLRQEEKLSTPVIILSAKDALSDMKQGYQLKADTYLVKPININDVVSAIDLVCSLNSED